VRRPQKSQKAVKIFGTLEQGEKFDTPFGVVEVIKDDRAAPTAPSFQNAKRKIMRAYNNSMSRYEKCLNTFHTQRFSQLRFRRNKINELFERKEVSQKCVFEAYLDPLPEKRKFVQPKNPAAPPESFPDRIVECQWIADRRARFWGDDRKEQETTLEKNSGLGKLYLTRRLLKENYVEGSSLYSCDDCGKAFECLPSHTYHLGSKPCKRRKEIEKSRRNETEQKILKNVIALQEKEKFSGQDIRRRPTKRQRKTGTAMYPEVLLALGFKIVKKDTVDSSDIIRRATACLKAAPEVPSSESDDVPKNPIERTASVGPASEVRKPVERLVVVMPTRKEEPPLGNPLTVMQELSEDLKRELRISADLRLGSMYTEVYHSLAFRYPGVNVPPKSKRKKVVVEKKPKTITTARKRTTAAAPALFVPTLPPPTLPFAIDTRALVDEALAGRYPSLKRYEGENDDVCAVCKKAGHLVCCDFCQVAEHWQCFRSKFTTKALEPGEDFMCHKCVGIVIARRNRAEKRRLGKNPKINEGTSSENEVEQDDVTNQYHEIVAEKGRQTSELVELLRDSQDRLNQSVTLMEMNSIRRKMMWGL
jgi:hypothetical protein